MPNPTQVPQFYKGDTKELLSKMGRELLIDALKKMLLIRNFETRAEAAYLQGKVGGFFHSYIGQEAIQVAAVQAMGTKNWWATSYRCHALALLLGVSPNDLMAELYGREPGNAKGRGGSMHLYTDRLLGGFGIVGGQIPVATGAGFTIKYQEKKDEASICFMGEGAVAQGAFHESMNLASLWSLPCIYVIENNQWGMGTAAHRALVNKRIAEDHAPSYHMKGYTFDGMDYLDCYYGFQVVYEEVLKTQRPVLIEVITERFKGHSVSDPGLYRTKEQLKECMLRDPLTRFQSLLIEAHIMSEAEIKSLDKEYREIAVNAMNYADQCPWPDPKTLGQDVFAPETEEGVV